MSVTALAPLTSAAARALTEEVKGDAAALWTKLLKLYEGGAHVALGYDSWGAYYESEFGESGNYGYRLLKSAEVMEQLPMGNSRPKSERVARELVPVLKDDPEKVEEVWAEVVDQHGPEPTAKAVRETVQRHHAAAPTESVEPEQTSEPIYAFVTEVRFQHDASNQKAADEWAQRLTERVSRSGAVCLHRTTRSV